MKYFFSDWRQQGLAAGIAMIVCCVDAPVAAQSSTDEKKGEPSPEAATSPETAPTSTTTAKAQLALKQPLEDKAQQLETRLAALEAQAEERALDDLVEDAKREAQSAENTTKPEGREFLDGGLALQKLNPELTIVGDMVSSLILNPGKYSTSEFDRSGTPIRAVGLHFQHELDPYAMFKGALHLSPHEAIDLEEAYVTWFGIFPSISLSAGRFRQGFGVVNRWHEHDLDQVQYPVALEAVLGRDGLVGNGISLKWMMPRLWAHANELTLEVVDGSNPTLFAGEHFSVPSTLLRLKSFYDLSGATYLEFGLTGMFGVNNRRGILSNGRLVDEPWRKTTVAGADLTLT